MNDLRYTVRMLLKNPGFTAVAVLTFAIVASPTVAHSQASANQTTRLTERVAETVPLQAGRWHLEMNSRTSATIEPVKDRKGVTHEAIHFRVDYQKLSETRNYEPGTIYVPDLTFHNGTIEADLIGPIEPDDRTFVGIAFRIDPKNPKRHELVYFRPFNSGTERHLHTVQYVATGTIYDWPYLQEKPRRLRGGRGHREQRLVPCPSGN